MSCTTQLIAPGKIEIKQRDYLSVGPAETIIEVEYAGVCGTDLALFHGEYPALIPHVYGH